MFKMCDIEHSIQGDDNAEVEILDECGSGFYLRLVGNGTGIICYLDDEHMQEIFEKRLYVWGFDPSDAAKAERRE